ncbi:putative enoyl-CoA hydratase echA8 [Streptomyces platensis]|uniref:Enoyl-CoA hydratase echA8 n=1 Tax=Streptomyces platensis TaxID=58346 RepID=A0ABX3Y2X9_STRPT|nr:putative enoyl-CoA hydratase echA8 [Streptomyces platensis]
MAQGGEEAAGAGSNPAGAGIKEMAPQGYLDMYLTDWFAAWDRLGQLRTPTIAAVSGLALGGGCELAMLCDILLAADTAVFGQPEIKPGVVPGIGGSQRLPRAVGKAKAKAMEICPDRPHPDGTAPDALLTSPCPAPPNGETGPPLLTQGRASLGRADQRSPAKRSFSGTAVPVGSWTRRKVSMPISSPNLSLPILRKKMFSP